jgi:magnesium transporter
MDVYLLSDGGIEERPVDEIKQLLDREDAITWVDVPMCDMRAIEVLNDVFGFHPLAVHDCVERNHVPKVHVYRDHVFVVLHAPHLGKAGHVHYIELDQFVGANYLVTVHGPLNPVVDPEVSLKETRSVRQRIGQGHISPTSPFELSYAIVSALTRRQGDFVANLARESGVLEQRVMFDEAMDNPDKFLEELFKVWYELLAVRTMAALSTETYGRMAALAPALPQDAVRLVEDLVDQFDRVQKTADGQREFLHGVIEFFQARLNTQITIATEELAATSVQQNDDMRKITAWVAIIAVPAAVTGFFGMNVPYPGFGRSEGFYLSLTIMAVIATSLYAIFRHKKWL